ncbi:MAG TPA: hypothetical protein VGD74_00390 [Vulgatibacter sp.]
MAAGCARTPAAPAPVSAAGPWSASSPGEGPSITTGSGSSKGAVPAGTTSSVGSPRPGSLEPPALESAPPPAEVQSILDQVQGYQRWPNARRSTTIFSEGHGGRYLIAYYNGLVAAALRERILPFPDGAQLVAENRRSQDETEPPILTIMSKQGDRWYWAEVSNASVVLDDGGRPIAGWGEAGTATCASCHARSYDNDSVFQPRVRPNRR